ncbi:hypothetical protein ATKI12_6523 [Kitasatospora sp. Ki12]
MRGRAPGPPPGSRQGDPEPVPAPPFTDASPDPHPGELRRDLPFRLSASGRTGPRRTAIQR